MRKPLIESRMDSFAKVKTFYPKDKLGEDQENAFNAFELALDHGNSLVDLIYAANNVAIAASQGADVPELVEFLVSTCWTETSAPH